MLRGITVGCGFFGNLHLEAWSRIEKAHIVAVVDKDEQKAEEAATRFGIGAGNRFGIGAGNRFGIGTGTGFGPKAYADLGQAIEETSPDFVDVATRPDSHLAVVEVAAAQGCHVLCQKPLAPTWPESVEIVEACKRYGVRLMVHENWRWQPWYREIKKLIASGIIGPVNTITLIRHEADALLEPPFPDQPYFVDMERFLVIESMIHLIDTARFLGGEIDAVTCHLRKLSGVTKGEDSVHLHLRLRDEAWGILYSTRCSEPDLADPVCDYARIEGRKGYVRLDRDGTLTVKPLHEPAFRHDYAIPEAGYRGDSVRRALQHFADCLASNAPFETEGEEYLQVMRAVFAAYESAEAGTTIAL
jgi:predicted dehydrogenase